MSDNAWLVVIDMQRIFGEPSSAWCTPGYPEVEEQIGRLAAVFGERVVFTRFIAPDEPKGAWIPYYELWKFALVRPTDRLYELTPQFRTPEHPVVTRTTFGKWDGELAGILGPDATMILAGVSTDCCVISTALAAADSGVAVQVVGDACAGISPEDHQRALDSMGLYAPLIEITSVDAVLESLG